MRLGARQAGLSPVAGLGLEAIDEVDYVVEAATGAGSDAASGDSVVWTEIFAAEQSSFGLYFTSAELVSSSSNFQARSAATCRMM